LGWNSYFPRNYIVSWVFPRWITPYDATTTYSFTLKYVIKRNFTLITDVFNMLKCLSLVYAICFGIR
jgi:type IV secretory pathway TraG/TraD family ATPase VirD4